MAGGGGSPHKERRLARGPRRGRRSRPEPGPPCGRACAEAPRRRQGQCPDAAPPKRGAGSAVTL